MTMNPTFLEPGDEEKARAAGEGAFASLLQRARLDLDAEAPVAGRKLLMPSLAYSRQLRSQPLLQNDR